MRFYYAEVLERPHVFAIVFPRSREWISGPPALWKASLTTEEIAGRLPKFNGVVASRSFGVNFH